MWDDSTQAHTHRTYNIPLAEAVFAQSLYGVFPGLLGQFTSVTHFFARTTRRESRGIMRPWLDK